MSTLRSLLFSAMLVLGGFFWFGCNGDQPQSEIPDVSVNLRIDINDPIHLQLNPYGGYEIFPNFGYRGIIVYHNYDDSYSAYDLTCSYEPSRQCSRLEVDENAFNLICGETQSDDSFEKCCDSKFGWDGFPVSGPAQYGLKAYLTSRNGNLISITN